MEKKYLIITKKHRMENSQNGDGKINQVLPYILTNNMTALNELIYAETKLFCEKIGIPSKSTKKKIKT